MIGLYSFITSVKIIILISRDRLDDVWFEGGAMLRMISGILTRPTFEKALKVSQSITDIYLHPIFSIYFQD